MPTATCPSREMFLQYSLGLVSEEQSHFLADHLDSCPDCQEVVMTLDDADDTVVGRLRMPLSSESVLAEPQLQRALAAAIAMPMPRPGAKGGANLEGELAPDMPETLGEYQLLEELGRGGMGRVYKALQTKLDRVVALKVLPRGRAGDRQAINRFEREMKAVGRLAHPNIVQAYDAREINDMPVLIMEFVDGLDLAEIVRRVGTVPVAEACELVRRTALALQCAHEHGLVHRDIKPSNIMLTQVGEVKLLDLGLARFYADGGAGVPPVSAGEEMTDTGQAMGTADYMAPEQASDSRTVDIRADIYSLGCTFYKLLSGRAPFSGPGYRSTLDKLNAHVHQPVPPIRNLAPDVPEELVAVLNRMLAKDPGDRFATPADVAAALEPFCKGANLVDLIVRAMAIDARSVSQRESTSEGPVSQRERVSASPLSHRERARVRASESTLRRPILKRILIGLAILAAMAASFAAGILIMIKRDGNETKIEVPDGSNTRVTADGQLEVTLPSQMMAAKQAQQPKEAPLQFGPVIERVVNAAAEGKGGEGLELVGGKLLDVPKEFGQWPAQQQDKWSAENNVDLVVDLVAGMFGQGGGDNKSLALVPQGLKLAALWNEGWEDATGKDLHSALTSATPEIAFCREDEGPSPHGGPVGGVSVSERHGVTYYVPFVGSPLTLAFQTRKGDLGILQVLRFTEEPRGMRIRYKLVQPAATAPATMPQAAASIAAKPEKDQAPAINPAAEREALQGQWNVVSVDKGDAIDKLWGPYKDLLIVGKRFHFDGAELRIPVFGETRFFLFAYSVGSNAVPRWIDLHNPVLDNTGELFALGIYEIRGDQLKLCLVHCEQSLGLPRPVGMEQRPKAFAVEPRGGNVLLTLKRYRPSADEERIEGNWSLVTRIQDGETMSAEKGQARPSFQFAYGVFFDLNASEQGYNQVGYILDPGKQPKTITMHGARYVNGSDKSQDLLGIYKFENGRLTIAYRQDGPRPEKFESTRGSRVTLLVLEAIGPRKSSGPIIAPAGPAMPMSGGSLSGVVSAEPKSEAPPAADAASQSASAGDSDLAKLLALWDARKNAITTASIKARSFRKGKSGVNNLLSSKEIDALIRQYETAPNPTQALESLIQGLRNKSLENGPPWGEISLTTDGTRIAERNIYRIVKDGRADVVEPLPGDGGPVQVYGAGKCGYGTENLGSFAIELRGLDRTNLRLVRRDSGVLKLTLATSDGRTIEMEVDDKTGIIRRYTTRVKGELVGEIHQLGIVQCPFGIVFPALVFQATYADDRLIGARLLSPTSIKVNEELAEDVFKVAQSKGSTIVYHRGENQPHYVVIPEDVPDVVGYLLEKDSTHQPKAGKAADGAGKPRR